jgi:hypothetical protein
MATISWLRDKPSFAKSLSAILALSAYISGCAGVSQPPGTNSSPSSPVVSSIAISPGSASLTANGTLQFAAAVQGAISDRSVTWKASAGSVTTSGLYTAPSSPGTAAVTATSNADPMKSVSATVTVNPASTGATVTSVTISPASASLVPSGSVPFAATVQGTAPDKTVTWTASLGTITSSGVYTAPPTAGTATVTATSNADRTKSVSGAVTINKETITATVTSVAMSPASASSLTGGTLPFTATVQGTTTNKTVTWKASLGTISSSGLYTAPSNPGSATVIATSNADPTKSAMATVTIVSKPGPTSGVVSVTISPTSASSTTSSKVQFTAAVQGTTSDKTVKWKASSGIVTSSGLYTAPSNPGTVTITATSSADPTKFAAATVTVTSASTGSGVSSVTISPASASSITSGTLPFAATVQGTTSNKVVTWKAVLGTISSSGQYTAPPKAGTDTVTATSNADPTKSALATVVVSAAPSPLPVIASLTATPVIIQLGQRASIQWSVTGASTVQLSGVPAVSGNSAQVTPTQTTTYTLTTTNAAGSVSQSVTVEVGSAQQSFELGVVTHFGQGEGNVQANLSLIQQMGSTSIRDEVDWAKVERQPGQYAVSASVDTFVNAAIAKGQKPLITLAYGNPFYDNGNKPTSAAAIEGYVRYAEFVARHFKGIVFLYEIWNEWDGSVGNTTPGTPTSYVNLLKAVYPRLKAVDPNIVVIGGAVTGGAVRGPWFGQMLAAGALSSADVISMHEYIYNHPGNGNSPETLLDHIDVAENTLRSYNGNQDFPLYLTETGWPTTSTGTPADEIADFNAQTILLTPTRSFLKGLWWYDFQDNGTDPTNVEDNFGLVRADLSLKPGYLALSAVVRWMSGAQFSTRLATSDPAVDGVKFVLPNGQQAMAVWRQGAGSSQVQIRGASTMEMYNTSATTTSDPLILDVTESPVWVTGAALELQ